MNKKDIGILILLASLLVLVRLPFLGVPLERDEGEYAYCAWQMQLGNMPYRDIMTSVSPAVFFLYRFAFNIFGPTLQGIRIFTLLYLILTLGLFYYLARNLLGRAGAFLAGLIFVFLCTNPGTLSNMSQREIFASLPLIASFILLQRDLSHHRWYYAAVNGLIIALVFFLKQTTLVQLLFVLSVWLWYYIKDKDHKLFWKRMLWLAVGLLSGISLFIFHFSRHQILPDFLYWVFAYPRLMSRAIAAFYPTIWYVLASLKHHLKDVYQTVLTSQFPLTLVLFMSLIVTFYKRQKELTLYWLWFLFLLLSTAAGFQFRRQYFQLLIVPQALLIAWIMRYLYRVVAQKNKWAKYSYRAVAVLLVLYPFANMARQYYFITPNRISIQLYGPQMFSIALPVGRYVASQTDPTDKIYILGSEQEIYFYSQRACVNNYITAYSLTYAYGDPVARQREVIQALRKELPPYILKINQESSLYDYPAVHKENMIFNDVFNLVEDKYVLAGFCFIDQQKELLVFGRRQVEDYLVGTKTLADELDYLYKAFGQYYPAILIFQRKDHSNKRGN